MSQLSQPRLKGERPLSQDMWVWLLSKGVNPKMIHRRPAKFLNELHVKKHHQLGLRRVETVWKEQRSFLEDQNYTGRKETVNYLAVNTCYTVRVTKGRETQREETITKKVELRVRENYSEPWNSIKEHSTFAQLDCRTAIDQWLLCIPSLPFDSNAYGGFSVPVHIAWGVCVCVWRRDRWLVSLISQAID